MIKWIKKLFKKKESDINIDEEIDSIIETDLEQKYQIIEENVGMMSYFFDITPGECALIDTMLRFTAERDMQQIYVNEHIIKNSILLHAIYFGYGSFRLAEDLCERTMTFNEFIKRITKNIVQFTLSTDEVDKYEILNSERMVDKINRASTLLKSNIENGTTFSIYIRSSNGDYNNSMFYDSRPRNLALDIANKVVSELDNAMCPLIITSVINRDVNEIISLLNKNVFIPIFEHNGHMNDDEMFNFYKSFNYFLIYNTYKSKAKSFFKCDYYVICEDENIQDAMERKLKRFKGYKYIEELLNDPKYPNSYFKSNINYEAIEYMKTLFIRKMIKTKDEIMTSLIDYIGCQYSETLEDISFLNKKKTKSKKSVNKTDKKDTNGETDLYKYEYSNTDLKLNELVKSLSKNKEARILFHGVSGTGKSLFAKKLGEHLNMNVKIVKASDILRSYVGESEQLIKKTFEEVDPNNTILVFDEIDTFIGNRSKAGNKWEVSQANEMLVGLENFKGIFIGTTNLLEDIDVAFHRRFDIKVKFDFMKSDESVNLFKDYMKLMKFKPNEKDINRLKSLKVTPAMFSVIHRKSRFENISNSSEYIDNLERECKYIGNNLSNRMGFLK